MPVLASAASKQSDVTHVPTWLSKLRWTRTSASDAVEAERNLLQHCKSPLQISNTLIGERHKQQYVHSISGGDANAQPIVCLQGYGAGAAIYYRNMDFMCRNFRMHCVDWIGTGLSGRPNFMAKNTQETEDFFIEALKAWYDQQGLEQVILMGHSLGGYLAALYAMRYPEDVKHLILVSPAAVAAKSEEYEMPAVLQSMWTWQSHVYRSFKFLFNSGVTPQMLIRSMGPWGHDMVGNYVRRRFREGMPIEESESASLQSYFYHISAAKSSGEHALRHIFHPFAWGKDPLEGRLSDIKVPVSFIYGTTDWMDPEAAERLCKTITNTRTKLCPSDQVIKVIPQAGHFVFLDQPHLFNAQLLDLCNGAL